MSTLHRRCIDAVSMKAQFVGNRMKWATEGACGSRGGLSIQIVVPLDGIAAMELTDQLSDGTRSGGEERANL